MKPFMKRVLQDHWLRYKALLPKKASSDQPKLPANLPYRGGIKGPFDYVLPDDVLSSLKYFFPVEFSSGEEMLDYEFLVEELKHSIISEMYTGSENVLTGEDFGWALHIDHEGILHVAGPEDLFFRLREFFVEATGNQ